MKANKGFTIIEVLVVIAIIAILTILIFPSLGNMKKKNRDIERIADISSIQLGLALYYSQHPTQGYPIDIYNPDFSPKYVTTDSLTDPDGKNYTYVPLTVAGAGAKCTYYHLGVVLELPSAQIDVNDDFDSRPIAENPLLRTFTGGKLYCSGGNTTGIQPPNIEGNIYNYNVHP